MSVTDFGRKWFSRDSTDGTLNWSPYLYLLPALVLYVVFLVYPMIETFILSFQHVRRLGGAHTWVGLQNYATVLNDPLFWKSAGDTLIFGIGMVLIPLVLGLGCALLVNTGIEYSGLFRLVLFLPVVIPVVVAGMTFGWLLGTHGLVNGILVSTGLVSKPMRFLNSSTLALPSVMLMAVWKRTGYYMVILLAGLQAIPDDVYEAAMIMGKTRWQMFRRITLPLLKPAIIVTLIIGIVDSVKAFAQVYVMTEGGPSHSSEVLSTYFYKIAFNYFQFGKGAAYGFILFALALALSMIVIRLSGGTEI